MTPIEQLRAALAEIGKGIDLIDCSGPAANQNIAAITKLILPELKRALAALNRMESALIRANPLEEAATRLLELAREERNLDGATINRAAEYLDTLRALKQQPMEKAND